MPNAFDTWFEDSHNCSFENDDGYCGTHDSLASRNEDGLCEFAAADPLRDEHDIAVEDELTG